MAYGPLYRSLDHWRGLACLMVVAYHSAFYAPHHGSIAAAAVAATGFMWAGVPVFFVISGYCVSAAADATVRKGRSAGDFFRRRFRRIFPPYWAALALAVPLVWAGERAWPGLFTDPVHPSPPPAAFGPWQWAGNLTLTEEWRPLVAGPPHVDGRWPWFLGQAWTLCYEEQFYAVLGLAILLSRRHTFALLAVPTALTLAAIFGRQLWRVGGTFLDGHWLDFAAGVAVYLSLTRGTARHRVAAAAALMAGATWAGFAAPDLTAKLAFNPQRFLAFSFALAALALRPFDDAIADARILRPFAWCGAMCYSLYLVHWPLVKAVSHALFLAGLRGAEATMLVTVPACLAASLAAGAAFFLLVERRFLNTPPPVLAEAAKPEADRVLEPVA